MADVLGIPFYVWDMAARFTRDVVDDFRAEYAAGRTPNPCLRCNEKIKFAALLDKAVALGFDAVATGHYAQVVETTDGDGGVRRELHRAVDTAKDQSYVLGVLDAEQLARSFFPLGDTTKPQIREEAAERGFYIARKPDSHDICFIPDGDTRGWLTRELGAAPGDIVDTSGEVVGHARGSLRLHRRTATRARALAACRRRGAALRRRGAARDQPGRRRCRRPARRQRDHRSATPAGAAPRPRASSRSGAQVRAHGEEHAATAWADGDRVEVRLEGRIRGVAPGQSVVLYDGTRVVGSATIAASRLERTGDPTSESRTSESRSSESGSSEPGAVSAGTGST